MAANSDNLQLKYLTFIHWETKALKVTHSSICISQQTWKHTQHWRKYQWYYINTPPKKRQEIQKVVSNSLLCFPTWINFTDTMRALVSGFRALYKVVDWCQIFLHNCVTQCRDFVTRLQVSNPSLSTMGVCRSSDWALPAVTTTVREGGCRTIQALFPGRNQSAVS